MVETTDYHWVNMTKKNMVTSDSNYDHFFSVVVTGPFLQCSSLTELHSITDVYFLFFQHPSLELWSRFQRTFIPLSSPQHR